MIIKELTRGYLESPADVINVCDDKMFLRRDGGREIQNVRRNGSSEGGGGTVRLYMDLVEHYVR